MGDMVVILWLLFPAPHNIRFAAPERQATMVLIEANPG
jgi:hypothetical protein